VLVDLSVEQTAKTAFAFDEIANVVHKPRAKPIQPQLAHGFDVVVDEIETFGDRRVRKMVDVNREFFGHDSSPQALEGLVLRMPVAKPFGGHGVLLRRRFSLTEDWAKRLEETRRLATRGVSANNQRSNRLTICHFLSLNGIPPRCSLTQL
jgi:hypothetical protein